MLHFAALPAARRCAALLLAIAPVAGAAQRTRGEPPPPPLAREDTLAFRAVEWRNIGPFRGGRVTAVAGVPSQPLLYYMGATGGGVWKTEDGGANWRNISDKFLRTGSVGAIAVAPSDPNVIYVGMGEAPIRGVASSYGDGVYKSTDAGRTWSHLGLEATRQISRVLVHPQDPDVVWVAAQGARWAPTADRGVYKSTDGGRSWKQVHSVPEKTAGASDMAIDPTNPRILYVGYWDHQRLPWQVRSGGPGSGIWKSADGGETWVKLTNGLPKGTMGKIGVAVSANPDRLYAIIEADSGGLYRSDDAGKSWRRVNEDRLLRARAWYYTHITADPQNADVVYVLNAPFLRSVDGGRTFQTVPTPHGDNHALWINPTNSAYMINGNDGGANVSFNGGRTWSTQENQPTAQFYRVNADEQFPYRVYGGQQDNTSVIIASRTTGYGIDRADWTAGPGCESAYLDFDPRDPRYVYGGCYQGIIEEWDRDTGYRRNIMAYPALGLAEPPSEQRYRFNWNAPIVTSPHDRKLLYHGGNVLFTSRDRGQSWTAISPDLTRNEKTKQGPGGGPITNEGAGGEVYGTILYVVESPHEAGTIWVGTDDGLVQLTRDAGKTWANVTPRGLPEALVNSIEVSPHDRATAYAVVSRHKFNDNAPHIFRTTDYGRSWRDIAGGLPQGHPARVVREDPERRGLLYAGTETGLFLSMDAGATWRPFQLNLPVVPITDLKVHRGDLVAATEGRAFWILDDLSPVRQWSEQAARADVHLYKPRDAYRIEGFTGEAPNVGRNPPNGAVVHFSLAAAADSTTKLRVEFLDGAGKVLRTYTTDKKPAVEAPGAPPAPAPLAPKAGLNRVVWDLRTEPVSRVAGLFLNGSPNGYRVMPGRYQVRLTLGSKSLTESFQVLADPRVTVAEADFRAQQELVASIQGRVNEMHEQLTAIRDVREQVNRLVERTKELPTAKQVADAGKALADRITKVEERLAQPKQRTFQDVINFRNGLDAQYLFLSEAVDDMTPPVTAAMTSRMRELDEEWGKHRQEIAEILTRDLTTFNALFKDHGIPAVIVKPGAAVISAAPVP